MIICIFNYDTAYVNGLKDNFQSQKADGILYGRLRRRALISTINKFDYFEENSYKKTVTANKLLFQHVICLTN